SDWGGGWSPNENGAVYTVANESVRKDPAEGAAIKEVGELIRAGCSGRPDAELLVLLRHRDQRIRLASQYELAKRGDRVVDGLVELAADSRVPVVARAHAIWGLGQIARRSPEVMARLVPLLDDAEPEMRVQAARTLGDLRPSGALGVTSKCIALLKGNMARV